MVENSDSQVEKNGFEVNNILAIDESCSNSSGSIDISVVGGTSPYAFLWSNSATTEDLTNLNHGEYACTITDDAGCEIIINETINGCRTEETYSICSREWDEFN